jgi:hypothetical protein
MWGSYRWGREAQTTIPCKNCDTALKVKRSCQHVYMQCDSCGTRGDINEYLSQMDDAMEEFMEGVYCDRV